MPAKRPRASGVLLHVTCLPSKFGIGDLGPEAYRFVDLLAKSGQHYWSILPLTPTNQAYGNSPYMSDSAFAGNALIISPESLVQTGAISEEDLPQKQIAPIGKVDFAAVERLKRRVLDKAYAKFREARQEKEAFDEFCAQNAVWLQDYTLYKALQIQSGQSWLSWSPKLRDRETKTLTEKRQALAILIEKEKYVQFLFFKQWQNLKLYCQKQGIQVIGDLPFYVSIDSADVWGHSEIFKLNNQKKPRFIAGVPPDYFSKEGQLWGTPVYDWQQLKRAGFRWWLDRLSHNLELYNLVRFDHFRGFIAYWEVAAGVKTAKRGRWIRAPSKSFFSAVCSQFPRLPFIAEDLGVITKPVSELINKLGIPGMKVLLFAFDGGQKNPHLPENHPRNAIAYTGTHDTNTVKGWFLQEATDKNRNEIFRYLGRQVSADEISREFVKLTLNSKANLALIPLQDILGLGPEARMNHPAKHEDNWTWRITHNQLLDKKWLLFKQLTNEANR